VQGQDVTFPGNGATLRAYQVRPAAASSPVPLVLVVHENQGLTEHIRDVTRRLAKAGYVGVALDLLSREGGTPNVEPARIPGILSASANQQRHVEDFRAAAAYYRGQSFTRPDRQGMIGFCFGGGVTWDAVEAIPEIRAAVPYYGPMPPLDRVPQIKAAVLGVYSDDPRDGSNRGRDELDAALTAANVTHTFKVYPGTGHAFNNDTGNRYNQEQALAAWQDTLDWFQRYLAA
jgi:carboxymethylenebutenolidase